MARTRSAREREVSERLQREFGQRVQRIRKERDIRQKRLALDLGLTRTSISNIEQGRQRVFLDQVYRLADRLDVPLEALLPSPQEVLSEPQILTAADDPMADHIAREAERVLPEVLKKLNRTVATPLSRPDDTA